MKRRHSFPSLLAGLFAFCMLLGSAACTTPCMQVQEILCECKGRTLDEQQACIQIAEAQERISPPSESDQAVCETLIPSCEKQIALGCETLNTTEGKQACGMALP